MTLKREEKVSDVWQWIARLVHGLVLAAIPWFVWVTHSLITMHNQVGTHAAIHATREDLVNLEYRVTGERHKALQLLGDQLGAIREDLREIKADLRNGNGKP